MNSVRLSWVVLVVTELLTLRILAFKQVHSIIKYVRWYSFRQSRVHMCQLVTSSQLLIHGLLPALIPGNLPVTGDLIVVDCGLNPRLIAFNHFVACNYLSLRPVTRALDSWLVFSVEIVLFVAKAIFVILAIFTLPIIFSNCD